MKQCLTMTFVVVLLTALLAGFALADGEPELKSEIQALLDQTAASMVKKDLDGLAAGFVPQAVMKLGDGRVIDMAQWRQARARDMADMEDISSKFVVERVWPVGKDKAGVIYNETHQFRKPSDPGHVYAIHARFEGLLDKTAQGWRFTEFDELGLRLSKDGKTVAPPAN